MNPFAIPSNGGTYPASNYNRSALPSPQSPQGGAAPAGMPAISRKNVAWFAAIFIVGAYVLFHWHYERD